MARLLRTQSLGNTVTRQHLYDLINTCGFTDLNVVVTGAGAIVASTAAPTSFTATTWWFDQEHQVLRVPLASVGGSPCSLWVAVGPDSLEQPVYNPPGSPTIAKGAVLSWKTGAAGQYDVEPTILRPTTGPTYSTQVVSLRMDRNLRNAFGVLQATLAAGQFGRAVYRGFGYGLCWDAAAVGDGNSSYPLVLSTAYTATGFATRTAYATGPWAYAIRLCRPPTTFGTTPVVLPVFVWMPFNNASCNEALA